MARLRGLGMLARRSDLLREWWRELGLRPFKPRHAALALGLYKS